MPRPGFYNDNEYRAYPFIYTATGSDSLPNDLIVDAGVIMGLDADFDENQNSVWLHSIHRSGSTLEFVLHTDAPGATNKALTFSRATTAERWELEYAETARTTAVCGVEPAWEGFLVTGNIVDFVANFADGSTVTFAKNAQQLEPARIQNLAKSYLRSINVGNYERTIVPSCDATSNLDRAIVLNTRCMTGDIKFVAGYYCSITQTDRANEINISGDKTAGLQPDAAFCAAGSEVPFYEGEPLIAGSQFYSGGPACDEVISGINGLEGKSINFVAGPGIQITTADNKITVALNQNSQNNCAATGGQ